MSQAARIGATLGASLMLALSACSDAKADSWTGRDKQMHAIAGAAIALPITLITRDVQHGIVAGCAVGVAKEIADRYRLRPCRQLPRCRRHQKAREAPPFRAGR